MIKTQEEELKELLLGSELSLLANIEERCEALEERVGDDSSLKESVRAIIVDVLRDAGVRDHERLAVVIAPAVISSIRTEIKNSRDLMVDALYPITGRLVAAAVRNAFRELVETLNERVDRSLSVDLWKTRLKAKLSGRSEAEILLEEQPPFSMEELFLINRPSGLLIARTIEKDGGGENQVGGEEEEADRDLIAAMLMAIMAFVRDAFDSSGKTELNSFSFGGSRLYLRTSPAVVLGVRTTGIAPPGFEPALDSMFEELLDAWGATLANYDGTLQQDVLKRLQSDLHSRFVALLDARKRQFRRRSKKGLVGAIAIVVMLLAWGAYEMFQSYRIGRMEDIARETISAEVELRGYPATVRFDHGSDRLVVEGLMPGGFPLDQLRTRLGQALPGIQLDLHFSAPTSKTILQAEQFFARLKQVEEMQMRRGATIDQQLRSLDTNLKGLDSRLSKSTDLQNWLSRQAIFFTNGIELDAPETAEIKLKQLASLFTKYAASSQLIVIGYSDRRGSLLLNRRVSQARAEVIAKRLIALGISKQNILAIGRAQQNPLATEFGKRSNNRRVEFEVRYLRKGDAVP